MMQDLVGIVRRGDEMERALGALDKLRARAGRVAVPATASTTRLAHRRSTCANLLTVSEAIARAAIERTESRGAQFRDDFPDKDAAFGKVNVVVRQAGDGGMQLERVPVPPMSAEQQAIVEEMK
jgi:succinate dehydrogenase / fumarate reductase flavoprotein subunit